MNTTEAEQSDRIALKITERLVDEYSPSILDKVVTPLERVLRRLSIQRILEKESGGAIADSW